MDNLLDIDHLLTTKPHAIRAVFVSDLHLSMHHLRLSAAFIHLLDDLAVLPNLEALFILGDWLDAWVGDDDYLQNPKQHWLNPVVKALNKLPCDIYIMRGNRDFMLSQKLCDGFGGRLIDEPYYYEGYRLEHGDSLCTDDVSYQHYRRLIQHPITKKLLSTLPLPLRYRLAGSLKKNLQSHKTHKNTAITDINAQTVRHALTTCTTLIHGHTHRPAVHSYQDKQRMVLGDWRLDDKAVMAAIGVLSDELALYRLKIRIKTTPYIQSFVSSKTIVKTTKQNKTTKKATY